LKYLNIDGRIILKCVSIIWIVKIWAGYKCFRTISCGSFVATVIEARLPQEGGSFRSDQMKAA